MIIEIIVLIDLPKNPFKTWLIKYTKTPINPPANKVPIIILPNLIFSFKYLCNTIMQITNTTNCATIELMPEPLIPILGLLINTMFSPNLINTDISVAIAGT